MSKPRLHPDLAAGGIFDKLAEDILALAPPDDLTDLADLAAALTPEAPTDEWVLAQISAALGAEK